MRFAEVPKMAWLTINRDCNMRCKWCYAQSAGYEKSSDMSLDYALKAVDIISDLNINKLVLIGGEPTKYRHLKTIISYCTNKNIKPSLITNGLDLSSKDFLNSLIESGLKSINVSIKGDSKDSYIENTQVDCYDRIIQAIENVVSSGLNFTVSYVLTNNNIDSLFDVCDRLKSIGVKNFYFSFCNPYFQNDSVDDYNIKPFELIDKFIVQANLLIENNIRFNFHATMPLCVWPIEFINKLKKHNCISTTCQLQNRSGIIFDTQLNLIACNSLYKYPYGIYNKDYFDANSLKSFLQSEKLTIQFKQLLRAPSEKCISCNDFSVCAGGCILQWFSYSFDDLIKKKEEYYVNSATRNE